MGVNATVVYDIRKHNTVALRTKSTYPKDRHEVHDTISSFSQHCESLRGVADTITEVCALWGGPPFVTYTISNSRFRIIVIWEEEAADVNIAYDVYHAVARLERAVTAVADVLARGETAALANVYEEAGYALLGDDAIQIPSSESSKSSTRTKILPNISLQARRSSVASPQPQKKKGAKNAPTLFGRIGAALKTATMPSDQSRSAKSKMRHAGPDGHNADGSAQVEFGPDGVFDDAEGALALPDDVFMWCNFGTPLPHQAANLDWFADLVNGTKPATIANSMSPASAPRSLPALRAGSTPSTPLTVPSTATPIAAKGSTSSIGGMPSTATSTAPATATTTTTATATIASTAMAGAGGIGQGADTSATLSSANVREVTSSYEVTSNVPAVTAIPDSGTASSSVAPSSATGNAHTMPYMQSGSRQTTPALTPLQNTSVQQTPTVASLAMQEQQLLIQQQQQRQQQQQFQRGQQQPVPQQSTQDSNIPVALTQQEDVFDVSQLGGMKDPDSPKMAYNNQSDASHANQSVEEGIRSRMNEFANTMQSGNFPVALQQVYGTLRYLCRIEPRRTREITTCSNYVLAQKILIRNAALDNELTQCVSGTPDAIRRQVESALLAMFLAELKHLLPRHRIAAMRVAVDKNIAVGNYGMASRWLRQLVEKAPANQKALISNQLQNCSANGEQNSHMPPTNRLCFATLQVVTSPYGKCDVCAAVYHATLSGVVDGQACDTCFVGTIHSRS